MMEAFGRYCVYLIAAAALVAVSHYTRSDFLNSFFKGNLVVILAALLAINTTARSALLSKLKDIKAIHNISFDETIRRMRFATVEQLALVVAALVLCILVESEFLKRLGEEYLFATRSFLLCLFFASLQSVLDTAKSIFLLMESEEQNKE